MNLVLLSALAMDHSERRGNLRAPRTPGGSPGRTTKICNGPVSYLGQTILLILTKGGQDPVDPTAVITGGLPTCVHEMAVAWLDQLTKLDQSRPSRERTSAALNSVGSRMEDFGREERRLATSMSVIQLTPSPGRADRHAGSVVYPAAACSGITAFEPPGLVPVRFAISWRCIAATLDAGMRMSNISSAAASRIAYGAQPHVARLCSITGAF